MIISASRRTDIPAFYSEWFMNRIRAGFCRVPNPYNRKQVSHISLKPEDVDALVFWTRNPQPLLSFLPELAERGFQFYMQYTLLDYPPELQPYAPRFASAVQTFETLAAQIGPQRVIWRYDPIIVTPQTDANFHQRAFCNIAGTLRGLTHRVVISLVDAYRKTRKQFKALAQEGWPIFEGDWHACPGFDDLMQALVGSARECGMEIASCAEEVDLRPYGIQPGKCIDDKYIFKNFGIEVTHRKDASQRKACGCVVSRDIGMYDTCVYGCRYCYATSSFERAQRNRRRHNPASPALIE